MSDEQMHAEWRWLRSELRRATRSAALGAALGVILVMLAGLAAMRSSGVPAGVSMTSLLLLLTVAVPLGLVALAALRGALWRRALAGELPRLRERRLLNACARSVPADALARLAPPERGRVQALCERERHGEGLTARDYARGLRVLLSVAPADGSPDAATRSETAAHPPAARDTGPAAGKDARRSPPPPR